ncbi:MAG: AMP-binding protein [Thermoleophilia bacterium]|nr:AMP-binding protein [Thermoleophilia bacterium]
MARRRAQSRARAPPRRRLAAGSEVVWRPSREVLERANVVRLLRRHGIPDYGELVRRSQEDPEWFWPAAIEDMGLEFSTPWERVCDVSRGPEWATWFLGGRVSIARNCVHRWAERRPHATAAVFLGEDGSRRELTFAEASRDVTRLAEGLAALGVREGDAVAIYLPMSPEVAIASHACAHLGAIQVPLFSGFAAPAVAARLRDAGAKVVISADASLRRGREVAMKEIVDEAVGEAPSVEHVLVWRRLGPGNAPMRPGRDVWWEELLEAQPGRLPALEVESEAPYLLTYTSGTTGRPKGIVHVQGGFLVSITREVAYQADAGPGDVVHFATDMGWIMGPWTVVGGGAMGATLVFAEGAPDWPPDRLWRTIESERVTVLGCSPTLVRGLMLHGDPRADLGSLRTIVTTGEPWNPAPYRWLSERVGGSRCPIINCSGGTEVGACFLSPTPALPIKECSLGGPALGMAMDVLSPDGRSLVGTGEVGELVCRKPFPGMTRGFWKDPERYLETYWRRIPGVWVHGDWASADEDGYWFLHGRSDDTLTIAGKRVGPAELESAAVGHAAVSEAAAVGVPHEVKGEVAWLFCVLVPGHEPSGELAREVSASVARELGKAFAPDRVHFVPALPKTRSAKIVRRAVRARALGEDPGDLSSVENPESLEEIARAV